MSVYITRTYDMDLIKSFMIQPDVFKRLAEDGMTAQDYLPDERSVWLLALMDFCIIGVCQVQVDNSTSVTIHPVMSAVERSPYGRTTIEAFIQWIGQQSSCIKKIMAWVPVCYPTTKNCALKLGFEIEGTSKKSIMKNNILQDQWILGLVLEVTDCDPLKMKATQGDNS